jgi:hypothetical protein
VKRGNFHFGGNKQIETPERLLRAWDFHSEINFGDEGVTFREEKNIKSMSYDI